MGARTGTIASGSATTAVLTGLVGTTGSDQFYAGYRIVFPDAGAAADAERFVTAWTDATGTATFATRSDATPTGERYILVPAADYTLNEYDLAWSEALRQSTRTYRQVIPITPNLREQPETVMDWLRGQGDVDAVFWNISPITLHNEDFALWQNGASSAPDAWTLTGAGGTIARTSGGIRSSYYAQVTRAGTDVTLTQSMPQQLVQWLTRRTAVTFVPVRAACWVVCSTASVARVGIRTTTAGVQSTTWSDYHTGSGVPEFLETSLTPTAQMTEFTIVLQVANTNTSAQFHAAVFMQNTTVASNMFQVRDQGSQFYGETTMNYRGRNMGGVPTLEFERWPNVPGQLIVYCRRPFPQQTALDDVVEDQYARALEWGLLAWLLRSNKPGQDRSRLDRIMLDAQREWTRFLTMFLDTPVKDAPSQVTIMGS